MERVLALQKMSEFEYVGQQVLGTSNQSRNCSSVTVGCSSVSIDCTPGGLTRGW